MVYALDISNPNTNPLAKFSNIASLANILTSLLVLFAALAFVFMMLMGAYTFMTAGGDAEKVKKAQSTLKYALIGLAIVLVSLLIVKLIEYIFGINLPL